MHGGRGAQPPHTPHAGVPSADLAGTWVYRSTPPVKKNTHVRSLRRADGGLVGVLDGRSSPGVARPLPRPLPLQGRGLLLRLAAAVVVVVAVAGRVLPRLLHDVLGQAEQLHTHLVRGRDRGRGRGGVAVLGLGLGMRALGRGLGVGVASC